MKTNEKIFKYNIGESTIRKLGKTIGDLHNIAWKIGYRMMIKCGCYYTSFEEIVNQRMETSENGNRLIAFDKHLIFNENQRSCPQRVLGKESYQNISKALSQAMYQRNLMPARRAVR